MRKTLLIALVLTSLAGIVMAEDALLIASFESRREFLRWEKLRLPVQKEHQRMTLALSTTGATDGKTALKITQPLPKQRISWGLAEGLPRDWSGWQEIAFDATYQGEGPGDTVGIALIVDDWRSTAEWKDVFHRGYTIRKGTQTCRVSIHEIATKIDVRRVRQITFTHSGKGPATWTIDNIRLTGKRDKPYVQHTPGYRVGLTEAQRFHWVLGEDFRQFQIVADGYYEPKGWMPSRRAIASMQGLAFKEISERAPGHENSRITLRLKKDPPALAPAAGESLLGPGSSDPKALPREAGSAEFWICPQVDTLEQIEPQTFLHAVADLENQVKAGFMGSDLFFEVRIAGERHIVRYWDQTIWGDIRKAPARFKAGERHHVRITWGPEGMYLNVDDAEVPYNLFMLHRKPADEPAPSPYMGGLPKGIKQLAIGADVDGSAAAKILQGKVLITKNGKRGPRWQHVGLATEGAYVSKALDRGTHFGEPAFHMQRFMASAVIPAGTSVKWQIASLKSPDARPVWTDIQPGAAVPTVMNQARYLRVRADLKGNGTATPDIDEWHIIQFNPPHPRLFLTPARIATIKNRIQRDPLKTLFAKLKGVAPKNRGHLHNAFLYHLTGDDTYREESIADFQAAAAKHKADEHWDLIGLEWMLPFLNPELRAQGLAHLASHLDRGIPRDNVYWNQSMNGWRHALHRGIVTNVALVGEEGPWVHDVRHSFRSYEDFIKAWMIPAFNQVGGVWPEGFGYHQYTGEGPVLAIEAWKDLTGEDLWPAAAPFFKNLGAWYGQSRQPHTNTAVHVNDDSGRTRWLIYSWTNILADVYQDPWLNDDATRMVQAMTKTKYWRTREGVRAPGQKKGVMGYFDLLTWLLFYNPDVPKIDMTTMPKARYFQGMDWMTTRSDWSADATFLCFTPYDWYGGHKQVDTGSFLISKGGELVDDPKDSRHWASEQHFNYRMKSVAHNVLYAGEPDVLKLGDGGQIASHMPLPCEVIPDSRYDTADTLAFQDTEHYTWMAADLTGAYRVDRVGGIRRVDTYVRSILFLRPDVIVVHDRVKPTDVPSRLAFVLHNTSHRPEIAGDAKVLDDNTTLYPGAPLATLADGKGKLFCQALLPEKAETILRKVPGTHKGQPVDKATVWQVEYAPSRPAGGRWIDFLVVMNATVAADAKPVSSRVKRGKGRLQLTIQAQEDAWDIELSTSDLASGRIRLRHDGKSVAEGLLQRQIIRP